MTVQLDMNRLDERLRQIVHELTLLGRAVGSRVVPTVKNPCQITLSVWEPGDQPHVYFDVALEADSDGYNMQLRHIWDPAIARHAHLWLHNNRPLKWSHESIDHQILKAFLRADAELRGGIDL